MNHPLHSKGTPMSDEINGGVVIADRPQISVELKGPDILITVASIADNFAEVQIDTVSFPLECARQVSRAINALLKT